MNWKKEGYQKDQKVFLVGKGMFTRDISYNLGTIIHAGTKILKVKLDNSKTERILEFKDDTYTYGALWGYGYYLYKSQEEYETQIKELKYREQLQYEAKESLRYLTNEQLQQIIEWKKEKG